MKGYVYRFYNTNNEIVYVGMTQNMKSRMCVHFTREDAANVTRQIPVEEIKDIKKVEYIETSSLSDARVLEAYLIAKCKPKYNIDFVEDDELTYELITDDLV